MFSSWPCLLFTPEHTCESTRSTAAECSRLIFHIFFPPAARKKQFLKKKKFFRVDGLHARTHACLPACDGVPDTSLGSSWQVDREKGLQSRSHPFLHLSMLQKTVLVKYLQPCQHSASSVSPCHKSTPQRDESPAHSWDIPAHGRAHGHTVFHSSPPLQFSERSKLCF